MAELATGVQVWSRWVNDRGGVNGHPVKILVADDGGDPSRHRHLVQQMVETHRVIAFLLNGELLTGAGSVEYLSAKSIPVLGSEGASDWFYDSPTYFTHVPTGQTFWKAVASSVAEVARAKGTIRWASISCTEATTCSDAHRIWVEEAEMKAQGVEPVYNARSSLAQPDFTAECLNARNAGAQVVSIVMDASSSTRIAASCARQGYRPIYAEVGTALKPEHAQDPNKSGGLIGSMGHFLWTDSSTPATAEFQAAFRRYLGRAPGAGHAVAFAAGRMFEKAARDIGEPPTSQAVLDGMWTFRGETLDGLVMPLTFAKGQKAARQICWATAFATRGRWDAFDPRIKCR